MSKSFAAAAALLPHDDQRLTGLRAEHRAWWAAYWNASSISLPARRWERIDEALTPAATAGLKSNAAEAVLCKLLCAAFVGEAEAEVGL